MIVVAHEMRGAAIDGAEQEHDIADIDRVVAEVEEDNRDGLSMPGEQANEFLGLVRRDAVLQQLLRILGQGVGTVEKAKLTSVSPAEDFRVGAGRLLGAVGGQDHIRVQHGAEGAGHSELGGDVLMALLQIIKRSAPLKACGAVCFCFLHGTLHDVPGLPAVSLAAHGLQPRLMPQKHGDAGIQSWNIRHFGLHISRDVKGHGHGGKSN